MRLPPKIFMTGLSCCECKHYKETRDFNKIKDGFLIGHYCIAFPDGIPNEIYNNGHYEKRSDFGQENDIIFDPDPKKVKRWEEWMNRLGEDQKIKETKK